MKTFLILSLFFSFTAYAKKEYVCTTEFGEQVPLNVIVFKEKIECPDSCQKKYDNHKTSFPTDWIDSKLSRKIAENSYLYQFGLDKKLKDNVKRRFYFFDGRVVVLESRYMKTPSQSFRFALSCPSKNNSKQKCKAALFQEEPLTVLFPENAKKNPLYDQRFKENQGSITLQTTHRDYAGFLVRVFKDKASSAHQGISASGEIKFFSEDENYSMDAGADEQLHLFANHYQRIAGLEIKLECEANK